jgi:hypothetical protein
MGRAFKIGTGLGGKGYYFGTYEAALYGGVHRE